MKNNTLKNCRKIFISKVLPVSLAAVFFLNINMQAAAQLLDMSSQKYNFAEFKKTDNIFEEMSKRVAESYEKQTSGLLPIWSNPVTNINEAVARAKEIRNMLTNNGASKEEIRKAQELQNTAKLTPEQFNEEYQKEINKAYKAQLSALAAEKAKALKTEGANDEYFAELAEWEAAAKADISTWLKTQNAMVGTKYKVYSNSFDEYKAKEEAILENYIQTLAKTLLALYKNYRVDAIRNILLELAPSISALKTDTKDFFTKEDKAFLRGIYREILSKDNNCDTIETGRTVTLPSPYIVHDMPNLPQVEKHYGLRSDDGCKRAASAMIGLSAVGEAQGISYAENPSSDAYAIVNFMNRYITKPAAPSVLLSGAAALLAMEEYGVLRQFINNQREQEVKDRDVKVVDRMAYNGIKNYLGPISAFANYPVGKSYGSGATGSGEFANAWEDLAYMLAEEGSKESISILKDSLRGLYLDGSSPHAEGILPFITGAVLSGRSGIESYKPYIYQEGQVSIGNNGTTVTNKYQADMSLSNANAFEASLKKLGNGSKAAGMAAWLFKSGMGDINADTKMALDTKLHKFYIDNKGDPEAMEMYKKGDDIYKGIQSKRSLALVGGIFITMGEIALTIWMFWDIAGWVAGGTRLFLSLSRAAKLARTGASVTQRAMMLRRIGAVSGLIKMRAGISAGKFVGAAQASAFGAKATNVVVETANGVKQYVRLSTLPKIAAAPVLRAIKPASKVAVFTTYPIKRTYQEIYAGATGRDVYAVSRESLKPIEAKTWLSKWRKTAYREVKYAFTGKDAYNYGVPEKIVNQARLFARDGHEMVNSDFRWNSDGTVSAFVEGKTPNTLMQIKNFKAGFEQQNFGSVVNIAQKAGFAEKIDIKAHIFGSSRTANDWVTRAATSKEGQFSLAFDVLDGMGKPMGVTLRMDKTYAPARALAGKTDQLVFRGGQFFIPGKAEGMTFGLRIPKYQLGKFADAKLPGLNAQVMPFLNYNISKTKIPMMLTMTGLSFSAASTALYIPLTSAPFMDKDGDASKNLITDGEATAVAVFLPYAFSFLSPLAGSWTNKFGAGSAQKFSLLLSFSALAIGTGAGYNGFIKQEDPKDIQMWPLFASAAMIGIGSAFNRSAMDVLTNRYKIGNFSSTRMFAKNVAGLASYLPPILYHGYYSLSNSIADSHSNGFTEKMRMKTTGDFSSTYPVLGALSVGALVYMSHVKLASGINKIPKFKYWNGVGYGFKTMFNKNVLPYIGALTLYAGFEGQAFFKTTNNFVKDELGYGKLKSDSFDQKIAALGTGVVMALVPGVVRFKTPGSEKLNITKFITGSVLSSATGALLLATEDPKLGWAGYALMGYGTANMYTGVRQGLINSLTKKGLYSDVKFQTNAMAAFTAGNMGVGVMPWINSKLVVDPRKKEMNETSLEAGTRTMWSNLLMLSGGAAISSKLGLFKLPKLFNYGVKGANFYFSGGNLLKGNPLPDLYKTMPIGNIKGVDLSKTQPAYIDYDTKLIPPSAKDEAPSKLALPQVPAQDAGEASSNNAEVSVPAI